MDIRRIIIEDGRYLMPLSIVLLQFFVERSPAPNEENADRCTSLEYLYNIFMMWNIVYIGDEDEYGHYTGWFHPDLDDFEDALRWCFTLYRVPGKICTKENGDKYVQGISGINDSAFMYDMAFESIDHKIWKLENTKYDYDEKTIISKIGYLERIKEKLEHYRNEARNYELTDPDRFHIRRRNTD